MKHAGKIQDKKRTVKKLLVAIDSSEGTWERREDEWLDLF
jgi:hypothetical protein